MHVPVLLQEVVEGLEPRRGETILDATVGGGGHSEALCRAVKGAGTIICLDEDEDALERSRARLELCGCQFLFYRSNFRNLDSALTELGIQSADRILFDLGLSSFQLEESGRGFSFERDEPLQMTFARDGAERTAETVVNDWSEETLAAILLGYADERYARRIARAIAGARERTRIKTSGALADIIARAVPRRGKRHPATKAFQAIRVAVNDEFRALEEALPKAWEHLEPNGRLAVISFQSMEDRLVKRYFQEKAKSGAAHEVTKKPITPSDSEIARNPRSRSAKLRIVQKVRS